MKAASARWRIWPDSLAGRLIALLLLALILSQAAALVIFSSERRHALLTVSADEMLVRSAGLVRLLADAEPSLHSEILRAASSPRLDFRLAADGPDQGLPEAEAAPEFAARLAALIGPGDYRVEVRRRPFDYRPWASGEEQAEDRQRRIAAREWRERHDGAQRGDLREDLRGDLRGEQQGDLRGGPMRRGGRAWMTVSVRLPSGLWLEGLSGLPPAPPAWAWQSFLSLILMAGALVLVTVLAVRRAARPLRRLAEAADQLGRGDSPGPLPEEGPAEVRRSTQAFNRMRERLERFVRDRTQMLAAMSHDLRTPITTLRLRAEFVEEEEVREKILETLDEMQRMAEESLAFARQDATPEESREVDLAALLDSLCADLREIGLEAVFDTPEETRCVLLCRPAGLKRAFRNLIENAARYGGEARVRLEACHPEVKVSVADSGPGIPEAEMERVFEPFVRLEESRSRETGGAGLGLAIARSILRAHGGEITLANRPEGGLLATVTLPRN